MSAVKTAALPDLGAELAVIADHRGKPASVFIPIEIWNEIPGELRDTLRVTIGTRAREPWLAMLPWRTYEQVHEAIEDAIDRLAFDRANEAHESERAAARRAGAEGAVPLEVVKAIGDGAAPVTAWRKYRGLRQAELAARSGVERSYISHIEGGTRQGTPDVLARIASELGCLIEDLLPPGERR